MGKYYSLEGNPISLEEWAQAIEHAECQVGLDRIGEIVVSTVWMGLNHNLGDGPPLIFETMVFGYSGDNPYEERYSTPEEALEGHRKALAWVKAQLLQEEQP